MPIPPSKDYGVRGAMGSYRSPGARKEALRQRAFRSAQPAPTAYAELRVASAFSFLEGASLPEDLVARAAELDLGTVALIDRDTLAGAPRFFKAAKAAGVKALVGAEVSLESALPPPPKRRGPQGLAPGPLPAGDGAPRLTLLARDRRGYRSLCRLLTAAAHGREKGSPRASFAQLEAHAEGLHCLTGGEQGALARLVAAGSVESARQLLGTLAGLYSGRLHVELQRHRSRAEEHRNRTFVELAEALRLPLLATGGVRHHRPEKRDLFDVLTAIRHHTTVERGGRLLAENRERHLRPASEMARLFADHPYATQNAAALAAEIDFTLADLGYRFPDFPLPPGETPASYLRAVTWNAARSRFRPLTAKAQAQLEHELKVIEKLDLAGYFLIVWDIVQFCRREKILVQGRGSAANSAVCYALGITAVDPVRMGLLFERFLSEERGEWPDIDLDLPSGDQREKAIQHLYRTYGAAGAAMTANVITYRSRSAAREVGKALGFAPDQVDRLSKELGGWGFEAKADGLGDGITRAGLSRDDARVRHFERLFFEIQNLPRHLGQHSGGMVMAQGRLDEVVPLEPAAMPNRTIVQWDKDDCADLGIIKVDLLGLGMLAALEEAIPTIRTHEGIEVDLAHLPEDDPKVYAMLRAADTVGVFQVESRAQMASLPRNSPERFYDLVVQVAIIRPGPIMGGLVNPYFDRRRGREKPNYLHPCLEPILARTLGVPIFQEQVLRMAMTAAGFTGGEAEELRRAMGFKRSVERMEQIEKRLVDGMRARGITGPVAEQIVRSITSFAMYGFPESHAASFALIAYASAYLKAYHPAAFLMALLNAWPMGFYHPSTLVKDAQRHSVTVLPIDVTRSRWRCQIEGGAVRLGLRYARGLRAEAGAHIELEAARAPFASLADFTRRTALRAGELEALAEIGALAAFGRDRRDALWQVARLAQLPGPLFADGDDDPSPLAEMSPYEATVADYRGTDLTTGPQLVAYVRGRLTAGGAISAAEAARTADGARVRVGGLITVRQRPPTAKGFLFITMEDETGMIQAIVKPTDYSEQRALIVGSAGLVVEGVLQKRDGTLSIKADAFAPLPLGGGSTPESHDFR